MAAQNSAESVFRFIQIRPAKVDALAITLASDTPLAIKLIAAQPAQRRALAAAFLNDGSHLRDAISNPTGQAVLAALGTIEDDDGTIEALRQAAGDLSVESLSSLRLATSDLLLAVVLAKQVPEAYTKLERIFRAASGLTDDSLPDELPIRQWLQRAITLPQVFVPATHSSLASRKGTQRSRAPIVSRSAAIESVRMQQAARELLSLTRTEWLNLPASNEADNSSNEVAKPVAFSLNRQGLSRLSANTQAVLHELSLAPDAQPLDGLVQAVESSLQMVPLHPQTPNTNLTTALSEDEEPRPYLKSVGIADLLVVKQHLRAYERMDIAHVENVMIGEKKSRNYRQLERTEDTITIEKETITEKQTELQTAERFELNRETNLTVKRDQQFGFGLTVSGKYGPTVDFSSNLTGNTSSSTDESVKSASTYAKDVMQRSLERVVERVREEQVHKVIRETEETNLHELTNDTGKHVSGVYQFIEKVYESQVFNYGLRQMFDFMVPEPSSYLWYVENNKSELNLPTPPAKLEVLVPTADSINAFNYLALAARYGVDGIEAPPPSFITVTSSVVHGQDASNDGEEGQPRTVVDKEIDVPPGYRPLRAMLRPLALTDDTLTLAIALGHNRVVWRPASSELKDVGSGHALASSNSLELSLLTNSYGYDASSKLPLHVMSFETNTFSVAVEVVFAVTQEAYRNWQIKSYDKLLAAYRNNLQKYETQVAELKAQADAEASRTTIRFGAPPSENQKLVKTELKKHCLAIVTRQRFEHFDAVQDADPPLFDFADAEKQGDYARFFEQAFEWDQMQYVFYPYFWGKQSRWAERFLRSDVDEEFLDFLKAGAARVVVPARPGFEKALCHYLETGEIWNGTGEPPPIHSPLYVPIVTEIRERTGAPQGEVAQGDPWETRLPTPLVILRSEAHLPQWERTAPDEWTWQEVPDA